MTLAPSLVISLLALLSIPVEHDKDGSASGHHKPTAVEVTPVHLRFCSPTPDAPVFGMDVKVRVRLTNTSARPLIVSREIPGIVRGCVADDLTAGREGRIRFHFGGEEVYSNPKSPKFGSRPDAARFAVLSPGQSLEGASHFGLIVRTGSGPSMKRAVTVGSQYAVAVDVPTWPYPWMSKEEVERLRERWRAVGDLITDELESGFFVVTVPGDARPEECNGAGS
jgi:hypothetical protein